MEINYDSADLLTRAMELLQEEYDPENDAFFVVVTHGGKDDNVFSGSQAIIGEINLKTVVAFITQIVHQLCEAMEIHPYTFITRHITAHFVDMERAQLNAISVMTGFSDSGDPLVDDLEEELDMRAEAGEDVDTVFYVKNPSLEDIEN
jgi:hypothetical protein